MGRATNSGVLQQGDSLTYPTLPAVTVDLKPVFDFPVEPGEAIDMVKEGHPPYGKRRAVDVE